MLIALQQHGNKDYLRWSLSFTCANPEVVSDLSEQAHRMETHLEEWKNEVSKKRDEFYELNYFTTQQLLFLAEDLGKLQTVSVEASVNPKTLALLESISPEVSQRNVTKHLSEISSIFTEQTLPCKQSNKRSDEFSLPVVLPLVQRKATEYSISDETKLALAKVEVSPNKVETESLNSVVVKEDLAASSITSDHALAPEPKITTDHLTDNQRKILINITENCGFAKKLVLLAFDKCENPDTEHEIIDWCVDHQSTFQCPDSDVSSESSTSAEESSDELEGDAQNLLSIKKLIFAYKFMFIMYER